MNSENHNKTGPQMDPSVAEHYADLTADMISYNGDLLACHYGIWGADTATERESMLRANRILVRGCEMRPGLRILDAGCGVGGTAIWLAETYGVHVTGITICEPHVAEAAAQANERGVGHLVEFQHGDFMNMPFPDNRFDVVLNHESICHAPDKLAYLRGVRRVLKPGGRWQALDGYLTDAPLSEDQERIVGIVVRNFHIAPLPTWSEMVATFAEAGLEGMREQDLTPQVLPSTEQARKRWLLFALMAPPHLMPSNQDFQWGTVAFDDCLRQGIISYRLVSGLKPA